MVTIGALYLKNTQAIGEKKAVKTSTLLLICISHCLWTFMYPKTGLKGFKNGI